MSRFLPLMLVGLTLSFGCASESPDPDTSGSPTPTPGAASQSPDQGVPAAPEGVSLSMPEPADGVQLQNTPFVVKAGQEVQLCEYITLDNSRSIPITSFEVMQSVGSHHLILYFTHYSDGETPWEDGIYPCNNTGDDPGADHRISILAVTHPYTALEFPPQVATMIPPHAQIVLEQHVINISDQDLPSRAMVNLYDGGGNIANYQLAYQFYFGPIDSLVVAPNGPSTVSESLTIDNPEDQLHLLYLLPHQHATGTMVTLDQYSAATGQTTRLVESPQWDNPADVVLTPDNPRALQVGDTITVTCSYDNPSDQALYYPKEMCFVLGFYTVDSQAK